MKTYHIKDLLKKELLIVELPKETDMKDPIQILKYKNDNYVVYSKYNGHMISRHKLPEGSYILLGKPDEIREEDARELVEKVMNCQHFQNYKGRKENDFANLWCKNATESLLSAIESEIYWENPIPPFAKQGEKISAKWYEAESRTFDRNRTLIFVKN